MKKLTVFSQVLTLIIMLPLISGCTVTDVRGGYDDGYYYPYSPPYPYAWEEDEVIVGRPEQNEHYYERLPPSIHPQQGAYPHYQARPYSQHHGE